MARTYAISESFYFFIIKNWINISRELWAIIERHQLLSAKRLVSSSLKWNSVSISVLRSYTTAKDEILEFSKRRRVNNSASNNILTIFCFWKIYNFQTEFIIYSLCTNSGGRLQLFFMSDKNIGSFLNIVEKQHDL